MEKFKSIIVMKKRNKEKREKEDDRVRIFKVTIIDSEFLENDKKRER